MEVAVSSEAVAEYLDLVQFHARRLDGMHTAEYDDLVQEGLLAVFIALREGKYPSKDLIIHEMHHWINKCARRGLTYLPADSELVSLWDEEASEERLGQGVWGVRRAAELP